MNQRRRIPGDEANTGNDPVLALYRNYFAAARRLHEQVEASRRAAEASFGDDREDHLNRLEVFLPLWLSALFTSCEGFRRINGKDPVLDAMIREIIGPLRKIWQHTVNFHDDAEQKQGRASFYGQKAENLQRAEALHEGFEEFFRRHVRLLG